MRAGFTLAELAVASVIILVVLTALAVALVSFVRGSRSLELGEGALTLARVEIAGMERSETLPVAGIDERPDSLWGNLYIVSTVVTGLEANSRSVTVAVSSGDTVAVELTRKFYAGIQ